MTQITVDSTQDVEIGDGSESIISTFVLQVVGSGFTGSVEIQAKAKGADATAYTPIAYKDRSDETTATGVLTGDALVEVNASGLDLQLAITVAAGSVTVYIVPLLG